MIVNVFPELLMRAGMAPFLLRLFIGIVFIHFGLSKISKERLAKIEFFEKMGWKPGVVYVWTFGILEMGTGALLVTGLYTQVAALIVTLILALMLIIKKKHPESLQSELKFYLALFIISLSLLLTGAGAYAIDLPL